MPQSIFSPAPSGSLRNRRGSEPSLIKTHDFDGDLARAEASERVGLREGNFYASRAGGVEFASILHWPTGRVVFNPVGLIQLFSVSPDGRYIGVQVAANGREFADLYLVHSHSGEFKKLTDFTCRYDPMVWLPSEPATEPAQDIEGARHHQVLALAPNSLRRVVTIDPVSAQILTSRTHEGDRLRIFGASSTRSSVSSDGAGCRAVVAVSRHGKETELIDWTTERLLASYPAVRRVRVVHQSIFVEHGQGLECIDASTGQVLWQWHQPNRQILAWDVAEHTSASVAMLVAAVCEGRSLLMPLHFRRESGSPVGVDTAQVTTLPESVARVAGLEVTVTAVSSRGADLPGFGQFTPGFGQFTPGFGQFTPGFGQFTVLVEAPDLAPREVSFDELWREAQDATQCVTQDATRAAATLRAEPESTTRRHLFPAQDGCQIPVVVTSPSHLNGAAPLILTCYGGFGVPLLPTYEPTIPAWLNSGGRYAFAQIRGGGEYGLAWHQAGRGSLKMTAVDDLAAIARGLIESGYTTASQVVVVGASLGGIIATLFGLKYPELCAAVVSVAAPLDLERIDQHPLGRHWISEFCDPNPPTAQPDPKGGLSEYQRAQLAQLSPLRWVPTDQTATHWPKFLGVVLADDTRVLAVDTYRMVAALHRANLPAEAVTIEDSGHAGNRLSSLHRLGLTILNFAYESRRA